MEGENSKLDAISEIYSRFTESNKNALVQTAESLLEVQRKDAETLAQKHTEVKYMEVLK